MTTKASKNFLVEEGLRIAIQKQVDTFLADDERLSLQFPVSLTSIERGFVHKYVQTKGLKSKSHGKGDNRCLTIYKPNTNTLISYDARLEISAKSSSLIKQYLQSNCVIDKKTLDEKESTSNKLPQEYIYSFAIFKLSIPPSPSISYSVKATHLQLPITNHRFEIMEMINENKVVVISGDTGSGKTTQIPQYIMEDCCIKKQPCRIICTQPRRIAAVSMADRVAYERGENVGGTVGFQIRLESKISPTSNLIYTTSGFLLRCLISDTSAKWLSRITHIIMDEIHERDRYTDFLFIAVKEALITNPKLKVILMSATIDTNIFTAYFDCPLMKIPGRMHPVHTYQLEDVLGMLDYFDERIKCERPKKSDLVVVPKSASPVIDDERRQMIDEILQECFHGRSDFEQFFYLVSGEGVDVNIKHSDTELSALIIAAINGLPDVIETLLQLGADPRLVGGFGYTAKEWAIKYENTKCVEILQLAETTNPDSIANLERFHQNQRRLQLYLDKTNESEIDHVLLFNTIKFIHDHMPEGSILVFLTGYDAIVEQMNILSEGNIGSNTEILFLHGNMETTDQKRIFSKTAPGSRKIILSTNIAETSLTIDDVVYVIDCGKVKQISFDSLTESTSLTETWISKACAKQRMGRAGRTSPGICFRLYSDKRFEAMEEFTLPELLRIPLTELCLHARIMTKTSITDYLSKALQPPAASTVNQSIRLLKTIGALNENEDVTELGYRLVDLPVDVQLGKMLLYSILMKCLDPVLTIISALSVKDPFVLNFENDNPSTLTRKSLASNSCSDLIVFMKLYHLWQKSKAEGCERRFCRENNISNGIMELINGFRSQILGQLRTTGFVLPRGNGDMADLNRNSNNFAVVKACFVAGFYPNICRVDRKVGNLKSKQEKKLLPHITSVLREKNVKAFKAILTNLPSEWVVFEEKSRVERLTLVRNNTVVSALTVALFGGPTHISKDNVVMFDDSDSENEEPSNMNSKFILDDWIYFVCSEDAASMIHELRTHLNAMLMKTLSDLDRKPEARSHNSKIVDVISAVLQAEDDIAGFANPADLGTRPMILPIKPKWHSRAGAESGASSASNARSSIISYEQNQRLSERAVDICLYRRNNDQSGAGGSNIHFDFNLFISSYYNEMKLKKKVRYFVLHAESKSRVITSYKCKDWQYAPRLLKRFKAMKHLLNDVDIIVFFLIPKSSFYTVGRLKVNGSRVHIESFCAEEVTFVEARKMIEQYYPSRNYLELSKNGAEIFDLACAEQFLHLFLRKRYYP